MSKTHHAQDESYIYGTNFRHTVEFSRNGRTPLRTFRPRAGATFVTLPGQLHRVNPDTARLPAWGPRWGLVEALGRYPLGGLVRRAPLSRFLAANKENLSQPRFRESNLQVADTKPFVQKGFRDSSRGIFGRGHV